MKLFWKIYIPVFVSFVLAAFAISYVISGRQISDAAGHIVRANGMLSDYLVKQIGSGLLEGRLPFDSLKELSGRKDFLFWWVVQEDGEIYLADNVAFAGSNVRDYFPQIVVGSAKKRAYLNHDQEHGIYIQPFEVGKRNWAFWLGFSLRDISRMRRDIIAVNMVIFATALVLLGTTLYFIIKHFIKPIGNLALAATAIGSGDLGHRARVESGDELGDLARSFNTMAENLQRTTVSKAYMDNIVKAMKDPLFVVQPDRTISTVNEATCKLLGFQKDELVGKPIDLLFSTNAGFADNKVSLEKLLGDNRYASYETRWKTKGGNEIPVLFSASAMTESEGQPVHIVATAKDISELKRVEEELRNSQERFRIAAQSASDLIYEWNIADGSVEWFGAIDELLGHGPNEFPRTYKAWAEIIHPEDHDRVMASVDGHLKSGEPLTQEYRVQRKDGSLLHWTDSGTALKSEHGHASRWIGAVTDVTKRKQREDALRASEARNRLLVEESPVGICIVQDERFVYVNPAFTVLFGCHNPDELLGESALKFVAPDDRERVRQREKDQASGKGLPYYYEIKAQKRSGDSFDVSVWPRKIEYAGKWAVLSFVVDTSEAKTLRTQLMQAQKMEALGTLSGGIAHDFNNMLTIILGYGELLLSERGEEDPAYRDLQKIVQTARKGADLVQGLLTFSKQTSINPRSLDLNAEIEQFETLLSRTIPKMIEIKLLLSDQLAAVYADPVQIDQILMNLAINAKDAMPEGGTLTIETKNICMNEKGGQRHISGRSGDYVLLAISDTGHGMDSQTMLRIFDPFFTTKERDSRKGAGLGLAVVKGIVERHGGYITCHSEPGLGATFKVYFPAAVPEPKPEESTQGIPLSPRTKTVLLVDDEKLLRDLGKKILSRAGYSVLTASNGKEALERYRIEGKANIALVILDLIMPEMSGKECLRELLKIDSNVKVVLSSGYSTAEEPPGSFHDSVRSFVKKPYDMRQLLETVRKVLDS